jgi:hypothetical protein
MTTSSRSSDHLLVPDHHGQDVGVEQEPQSVQSTTLSGEGSRHPSTSSGVKSGQSKAAWVRQSTMASHRPGGLWLGCMAASSDSDMSTATDLPWCVEGVPGTVYLIQRVPGTVYLIQGNRGRREIGEVPRLYVLYPPAGSCDLAVKLTDVSQTGQQSLD